MEQQQTEQILKKLETRKGKQYIPHRKRAPVIQAQQPIYKEPEAQTEAKPQPGNLYCRKAKPTQSHKSYATIDEVSRICQYPYEPLESYLPVQLPKIKSKDKPNKYHQSYKASHYKEPTATSRIYAWQNDLSKKISGKRICSVHCDHLENRYRSRKGSRSQNYLSSVKKQPTEGKIMKTSNKNTLDTIQSYLQEQKSAKRPQQQLKKYLQSTQIHHFITSHSHEYYQTFFGLQPEFYKLQTEYVHQLYQYKLQTMKASQQAFIRHQLPSIPSQDNLIEFIQKYRPYEKKIRIDQLMKSYRFYIEYSQNEVYFGERVKGQRQGLGVLITQKSCFQGQFNKGSKVRGTEVTSSGIYKGGYYLNKREGPGSFEGTNGQTYVGEWRQGYRHGNGVWTNSKGDSYNGEWIKGKCYGQGIYISYGKQYHGDFFNFKKDGWGRQVWSNGDKYEGGFKQGVPEGRGVYTWANGTKYEGQFMKGFRHGKGILSTLDGFIYRGQFCDEKPEGICQLITPNGDSYKGSFREGKKNGRGILTLGNGKQVLKGYWQNDRFLSRGQP